MSESSLSKTAAAIAKLLDDSNFDAWLVQITKAESDLRDCVDQQVLTTDQFSSFLRTAFFELKNRVVELGNTNKVSRATLVEAMKILRINKSTIWGDSEFLSKPQSDTEILALRD